MSEVRVQTMDEQLQTIRRVVERNNIELKQLRTRLAEQNRIINELRLREKDVNRFLGDVGSSTVGDAIRDAIDGLDLKL